MGRFLSGDWQKFERIIQSRIGYSLFKNTSLKGCSAISHINPMKGLLSIVMRITKNFHLCLSCFMSEPLLYFLCDNGQLATKFWVWTFVYEKQFMKLPCKLDFKFFPRDIILQMICWLEEFLMYVSTFDWWRWKFIHHGASMEDTWIHGWDSIMNDFQMTVIYYI